MAFVVKRKEENIQCSLLDLNAYSFFRSKKKKKDIHFSFSLDSKEYSKIHYLLTKIGTGNIPTKGQWVPGFISPQFVTASLVKLTC